MKLHEYEQILSTITYKPGWRLLVNLPIEYDLVALQIHATVTDAWNDNPARGQYFGTTVPMHYVDTPEAFVRWVRDSIIQFELHEVDEYLRINGEWVHHPHPELRERFPSPPPKREMTGLKALVMDYYDMSDRVSPLTSKVEIVGKQVAADTKGK